MMNPQPLSQTPQPETVAPQPNLRRERTQVASIAFAIAFITVATVVVQLIISALTRRFAPSLLSAPWFAILASSLPMYAVAMPLSIFFYRIGTPNPPPARRMSLLAWFGLLTVTFAITYFGNFIGIVVNAILALLTGKPPQNELQALTMNTPFWANLLCVGILAPILEELFYRKLVIDRLRRYGDLTAILVSGILFGLLHGNFSQFFYAAMVGILFGYAYLYTGKLRYTVALHMSVNLIGGVFATEINKSLNLEALATDPTQGLLQNLIPLLLLMGYLLFAFCCMILGPISVVLLRKHIRFQSGNVKLSAKNFFRVFFLNPPVWILLLLILASFIF